MKAKERPAGMGGLEVGGGQKETCEDYTTSPTEPQIFNREELLADLDSRMAEADATGDDDAWVDAFMAWLEVNQ